jgi:hypothetical protein
MTAKFSSKPLGSLEDVSSVEVERLWAQEALRRLGELDQNRAAFYPAEDVLRTVRSRLE